MFPAGVHVFPVRHHSPRASAALSSFLETVRPAAVLIEGPTDASALIDTLVDPATRPPVAILGYRTDGTPGSSLWPFAAYSPEYVALQWGRGHEARVEFIDITVGQSLAVRREEPIEADEAQETEPSFFDRCAAARGFRSFEEFWEASFEAPQYDEATFRTALLAWADVVRLSGDDRSFHRSRDAVMARRIQEVIDSGVPADRVAVVVGAAHAAAFVAGDVDPALEATLPAPVSSAVTLIPYSFPRLAAQLGYGAGNRAPQYYQRAHDAGCDYRRATLEVLVEFTEHLRLRGFAASLADTIEAFRLAVMLATIRGKAEPGLDEVREAAIAALCRGESAHVDGFLWSSVVGRNVGQVAARIGRNSLQEEFWKELEARRLPRTDSPETFVLRLNNPVEIGTSVFLHRLRVAGIPYASFQGTRGARGTDVEAAGGGAALARLREGWEAQWTPATDVALVEKIVLGDTLEEVATRVLDQQLGETSATGAAAEVLLESVVAACPRTSSEALAACDRHAADDEDLPSLARACRALSGLVAYGTSRQGSPIGDEAVVPLLGRIFERAVFRVRDACTGNDEAVAPAKDALRTLHEVALSQPRVDKPGWIAAARELVDSYAVNPATSGMACGLLYLAQEVGDDEVTLVVGQRLSNASDPIAAAGFLAGFFEVNALALVRSRPVVAALDAFITGLPADRFRDALPMLRRALGALGLSERRYLAENLLAVRGIGAQAKEAQSVLQEPDKEKLKTMNEELGKALDDLEDLL